MEQLLLSKTQIMESMLLLLLLHELLHRSAIALPGELPSCCKLVNVCMDFYAFVILTLILCH